MRREDMLQSRSVQAACYCIKIQPAHSTSAPGNAMTLKTIAALVLCSASLSVGAQQLYKCGNTYSQTPCGADAQQKKVFSGAPDAPGGASGAGLQGHDLCVAKATETSRGPNPDAIRVLAVGRPASGAQALRPALTRTA